MLEVLRSIDRRLALLSAREERDVRAALVAEVLNTESRQKIFDAIDGVLGNPELAKIGDVTARATQNFVNQLLQLGLVRSVSGGRETIVVRDEGGILRWYLARQFGSRRRVLLGSVQTQVTTEWNSPFARPALRRVSRRRAGTWGRCDARAGR